MKCHGHVAYQLNKLFTHPYFQAPTLITPYYPK